MESRLGSRSGVQGLNNHLKNEARAVREQRAGLEDEDTCYYYDGKHIDLLFCLVYTCNALQENEQCQLK